MSETYLKLIPRDRSFVPPSDTHELAVELLSNLLPQGVTTEVGVEVYDEVTFIDAGENIEAVLCPICGTRNSLYDGPQADATRSWAWWVFEPVEAGSVDEFQIEMKCCQAKVKFTELRFDWPAGFARFELFIRDPLDGPPLPREKRAQLERLLGCELYDIWAHY